MQRDQHRSVSLTYHWVIYLTFNLVCLVGCEANKPMEQESNTRHQDSSPIVALVGQVKITKNEVERRLSELSPLSRARYQNPERRKELIDTLIRFELLSREALKLGHGEHPEVQLAYKQAMVRELLKHEVRSLVKIGDITETEIKAYYQEHLEDYQRPALMRASHILLKTAAEANAKLKELLLHIKADPKNARSIFGEFATKYSVDQETRGRRGDLQYFDQKGRLIGDRQFPQTPPPLEVTEAVFKFGKIGEISAQAIQSKQGWHLLQRTGGKRAFKRALQEVKTEIRNLLFRVRKAKALEAYVTRLKSKTKVEINEEVLEKLKLDADRKVRGPKRKLKLPLDLTDSLSP